MEAKHSHLTKMQELEVSPLCPWVQKTMIDDFKKMSIGGNVTSLPNFINQLTNSGKEG